MEAKIIEQKIRDIIEQTEDTQPMLMVTKHNKEAKFGVYAQMGSVEGAGRVLIIWDTKPYLIPLNEIADVGYISKNMACYALNRAVL